MQHGLIIPPNRFAGSGRRVIVAVLLCVAVVGLSASASNGASATGADVVLVDLSFDRGAVGTPYSYVFEVDNWGPEPATQVEFTALVHGISSFESASSDQGTCTYAPGSRTVSCQMGEIASGDSETVEIVVMPSDPTDMKATVSNVPGEDPDTSNNSATSSPQILAAASADLWVYPNSGVDDTGFGSMGYAIPGERFDYSIDVNNDGPAIAEDVILSVLLPFGVEFQSAEVPCTINVEEGANTLVTCPLGTIETGRTVGITAMAPLGAAGQTLRTEVVVDGSVPDPGPRPNRVSNYLAVAPGLSAVDRFESEGNPSIDIPVQLYGSVDHPVTVDYVTSDGAALAGEDYEATSETLTFEPGQTTQSVSVPLLNGRQTEPAESFTVTLSNVDAGSSGRPVTLVKPEATATILDNDPKVSVGNARVKEGNKGARNARFVVRISHASPELVTARFSPKSRSARAGSDFRRVKKTVIFLPGQVKQAVTVAVIGDRREERTERFLAKLSKVKGGRLGDGKGIARILDND